MTVRALKKKDSMPYDKSTQKKYGENPLQKRSGFKMKGYSYPGVSPMKTKPTKQQLQNAANNSNDPNSLSNYQKKHGHEEGQKHYQAWKGGSKYAGAKKEGNLTHGAGGKLLNQDGSVNEEATRENVAHLLK